jgi:hypothetical protein
VPFGVVYLGTVNYSSRDAEGYMVNNVRMAKTGIMSMAELFEL